MNNSAIPLVFIDHSVTLILSAISFRSINSRQSASFSVVASSGANSYHLFIVTSALSGKCRQRWSICSNIKSGTPNLMPNRSHFFPTMFTTTCRRGRLISFERAVKLWYLINRQRGDTLVMPEQVRTVKIYANIIHYSTI